MALGLVVATALVVTTAQRDRLPAKATSSSIAAAPGRAPRTSTSTSTTSPLASPTSAAPATAVTTPTRTPMPPTTDAPPATAPPPTSVTTASSAPIVPVEPTSRAVTTTPAAAAPRTTDAPPARPAASRAARVPRRAGLASVLVASRWAGDLASPGVSSAEYHFTTVGGVVSATAAWSGDPTLQVVVACGGSASGVTGTSGLAVSVVAAPGPCTATVQEPPGDEGAVAYTVTARYRREQRA